MLKLFIKTLAAYKNNEEGVTAIEYGLIAAGISLAIAGVVAIFGQDLIGLFEGMSDALSTADAETEES